MPKLEEDGTPKALKPYITHGLDLAIKGDEATTDCPFCNAEGKFSIQVDTGEWRCFICAEGSEKGGGNIHTFFRSLWEKSPTTGLEELARNRNLLAAYSLDQWGIKRSLTTDEWLVPGYNVEQKLCQLYRYIRGPKGMMLSVTPETNHQIHGLNLFDPSREEIYVCEGWGDGVAFWEIAGYIKRNVDGTYDYTKTRHRSLQVNANIIAVPGANVWSDSWFTLFAGKRVYFLYDNDHHRVNRLTNAKVTPTGFGGMRKASKALLSSDSPPVSISYMRWGPEGEDQSLPDGYDLRDCIKSKETVKERVDTLCKDFLSKLAPIPEQWIEESRDVKRKKREMDTLSCVRYEVLRKAWEDALRWRDDLDIALTVCLAVAASTPQTGDQLFLQLIGDAGSAKTRICDGLLVSKKCHALEHMTGFHSGWRDGSGEDFSLIARINHKCLITPEGDVMMSSPKFSEIMSQQRRIFDGTTGATYKNKKEDTRYVGLRTPWIIAGTPVLMSADQARLGDRFLRIYIDPPGKQEEGFILDKVIESALRAVAHTSNGVAEKTIEERLSRAMRLTGGYVDYLYGNITQLVPQIVSNIDKGKFYPRIKALAEFTSMMRARPDPQSGSNKKGNDKDANHTKEMPTRLAHQFTRLACCLAVVLNKDRIDEEVLRRVTKVALDTSRGTPLDIVRRMHTYGESGTTVGTLGGWFNRSDESIYNFLFFLRKIGVVQSFSSTVIRGKVQPLFKLSTTFRMLYNRVVLNKW